MRHNVTQARIWSTRCSHISPYLEWVYWHATPSCSFDQWLLNAMPLDQPLTRFCSTNFFILTIVILHTNSAYRIFCCLWCLMFLVTLVIQNKHINLFTLLGFSQCFTSFFFLGPPTSMLKFRDKMKIKIIVV